MDSFKYHYDNGMLLRILHNNEIIISCYFIVFILQISIVQIFTHHSIIMIQTYFDHKKYFYYIIANCWIIRKPCHADDVIQKTDEVCQFQLQNHFLLLIVIPKHMIITIIFYLSIIDIIRNIFSVNFQRLMIYIYISSIQCMFGLKYIETYIHQSSKVILENMQFYPKNCQLLNNIYFLMNLITKQENIVNIFFSTKLQLFLKIKVFEILKVKNI